MPAANHNISAKDFRDPLLKVLGNITGMTAGVAVPFEKTYEPVFKLLGITRGQYGDSNGAPQTERWAQFAFNFLVEKGFCERAGRGQWALAQKGVDEAELLASSDDVTAAINAVAPVAPALTDLAPVAPVVDVPVVPVVIEPKTQCVAIGPGRPVDYHSDPYIRGLASNPANTPCFGFYTDQAPTCAKCPAKGICGNATAATFSGLAAALATSDLQAKAAAEAKLKLEELKKNADLFQKLNQKAAVPHPANYNQPVTPVNPPSGTNFIDLKNAKRVNLDVPSICPACSQSLTIGSEAMWVRASGKGGRGNGMYHIVCHAEVLAKGV